MKFLPLLYYFTIFDQCKYPNSYKNFYISTNVLQSQISVLLTRSFEAKLDDNGKFFPPRKEVTFNQLLSSNDGILGNYVAGRNKISYENAIRIIEKEVIVWKKRLKTQTVLFPGVGEIKLNQENKFEFSPLGKNKF